MSSPPPRSTWYWPRFILLLIAVICFALAVFRAPVPTIDLIPLGLAFGFAAFLFSWP